MNTRFKAWFWAIIIYCLISMVININKTIEINHLQSENAKFKQEIEYLVNSNELLQEDNLILQDRIWSYHDMKMKESAE